jgi:SMODS-associating 2TM, beta-strand rich effector domain
MPTPGWARFTLALFVGLSFFASLLAGALHLHGGSFAYVGATTSAVVLVLLFIDRWAWKWRGFRKVLRVPDLEGTWKIELESSFNVGSPVVAYLVVHQTYSTISLTQLTAGATSFSETSDLARRGGWFVLSYVYRAEPEVLKREGNEPHRGAAELVIETQPTLTFAGDYWTDRKTVGRIRAVGWNKQKCGSFGSANQTHFEPR